jgi:uncharacterized protein (DUF608 family)
MTNMNDNSDCGCGGACGDGGVDRRQFIKVAGVGLVSVSAGALTPSVMAGPFRRNDQDIRHFVPADKKLSEAWLASLTERGETRVWRGEALNTIAMPVGGVAAGQLYLRGDGTLASWKIFNQQYFSGYGRDNYHAEPSDSPIEQGFAVTIERGGQKSLRRLCRTGFEDVSFTGEYPIGIVRYRDAASPVSVEMEAFSPFIPLNAPDSALPATVFRISVKNETDEPLRAGVLSWLENAVCFHTAADIRAMRRSRIVNRNGRAVIAHTAEEAPPETTRPRRNLVLFDFEGEDYRGWKAEGEAFGEKPARGTLPRQNPVSGYWGAQLVNTFIDGDGPQGTLTSPRFRISRDYINFLIGGGNHPGETCINLIIDDEIVRTATGRNSEKLIWDTWDVKEFAGRFAKIRIVDAHSGGWGHINVDQITMSDVKMKGPTGPINKLDDYGSMALMHDGRAAAAREALAAIEMLPPTDCTIALAPEPYPAAERRGTGMLASPIAIAGGAQHTFTFVLAWHFPNRADRGNFYATRFTDASAVAEYVLDNQDRLTADTRLWRDTFYGGTLPHWLLERLHSTVSNLATGTAQWWADGRFWAWEGVGCCHGTCTHVWNYAHAAARLFPELERSAREMQDLGVALHDSGLVGFRGDLNNAYAADGQCGTVLKCYREHLMSPDNAFLQRNWPNIKRVLFYSIEQDANDDGLIENSQHNTYDINFHGANTFVGSLYLAALRAGEEMARVVGDDEFADRARRIFESGSTQSLRRLFNGEYFIQLVDLGKHPNHQYGEGCLSDQMFGQGWAHLLGLGNIYPPDKTRAALQSVWRYNWAPDIRAQNEVHKPERWFVSPGEAGLFTCTWPKSAHLDQGVRYRNEVWTGIEYQVAGHMAWQGMITEALAICRAIDDRYHPLKRNPFNEVECGDHYARALASWGVYAALCGNEHDGPAGHLGFAPRLTPEDFRAAFTTAEGWGTFEQQRTAIDQADRIALHRGRLRLRTLSFAVPDGLGGGEVQVLLDGRPAAVESARVGESIVIELAEPLVLTAGQALEIRFS